MQARNSWVPARLPHVLAMVVLLSFPGLVSNANAGQFEDASTAYLAKDYVKALSLIKPLAEKGEAGAQFALAAMYDQGKGVRQDTAKAIEWYRKSSDQGNLAAHIQLGLLYKDPGEYQDLQKSAIYIEKAAGQGDADSMYLTGFNYETGSGVPPNGQKAFVWYKKAAELGDRDSQNKIGDAYYIGEVVAQNFESSSFWYQKAADQGQAESQKNLGIAYSFGFGVKQDKPLARSWFRKAALQGNDHAQFYLGSMYASGAGGDVDYFHAYMWITLASYSHSIKAKTNPALSKDEVSRNSNSKLASIASHLTKDQLDRAKLLAETCMQSNYTRCD